MSKSLALISASLLVVGCSAQPAAPPPPTAQIAPTPQPSTDTNALPSPTQKWDVNTVGCQQWLDAADDDRAAVGMFYYGWLAGVYGIYEVVPANIQPNLRKVLNYCAEHHEVTIVNAFQATLAASRQRRR